MDANRRRELSKGYKQADAKREGGVIAIVNTVTGDRCLVGVRVIRGAQNRFLFSQKMNSCIYFQLAEDWKKYGGDAFRFEVVETLCQKEEESNADFAAEIEALLDMYK